MPSVLPWILLAVIVVGIGAIRLRVLDTPLERDEGEYAYAGQLMLQGIPPYQLAFNMKFPGTYAAYALIMALFGQTIAGIHLGFLVVNAATIVLVFLLGKRLLDPYAGVVACASYALLSIGKGVLGTQAHATHFVVIAALGGVLLLLRAVQTRQYSLLFWSGFLLGVSVLMKQHAVLFVAFGVFYLSWYLRKERLADWTSIARKVTMFCVGACIPLVLTGFLLWQAGVFDKFWFWTFTYAREYVSELTLSTGFIAFRHYFPRVIGWNFPLWALALAGLTLLWSDRRNRVVDVFLTAFLVFSALAMVPGLYFRPHYFVLVLPAVALLVASAARSARIRWPAVPWLPYGVFGAAFLLSISLQWDFLFQSTPLEISRDMYPGAPFPEAIEIGDYIRQHASPNGRIAVLGSEPEIYLYAQRHSATGQIYAYAMMEAQPYALTMQNEMIRDLETAAPEYIVFVHALSSWMRQPDSAARIFDWWDAYRPQHYDLVGIADLDPDFPPELHWDDAATFKAQSSDAILVFKRKDLP